MTTTITLAAPAKINLGLEILNKRSDGFHDIETVFQTLALADTIRLSIHNQPHDILTCSEPTLSTPENLGFIALQKYKEIAQCTINFHLNITKHIPAGGGLGGGSSDAATVLHGLQKLCQAPLTTQQLHALAIAIGSDVPFFLLGGTAYAHGRGEHLTPLSDLQEDTVTLIFPPFGCATPRCFAALTTADRGPRRPIGPDIWLNNWQNDPQQALVNRLTNAACRTEKRLQPWIAWLKQQSAPAAMSGSGSTCYVLGTPSTSPPPGSRMVTTRFRNHIALNHVLDEN